MPGQIKLPVVGPTSKRTLYLGGGAAVLVMGILWWRKRQAAAAAPATDTTDTTGLDTGLGTDFGGAGGGGGGGTVSGPELLPGVNAPTTNAAWTQIVVQQIGGVVDPGALSKALGDYLVGNAVTADEESLIDQAIAAAGYPPVAGPGNYPPGIRTMPSTGQTPPPSGGGSTPPAGGGDWTTHTTVHEGERLSQVLAFGGGMSQGDFEAHNPGITQYYRPYIAGKGYVAAGTPGATTALNTGHDVVVLVKSGGW